MATITTTTQANPFEYPNQAFMTVDPRQDDPEFGYLWVVVQNSAGAFEMWRSTDGGTTWTLRSTLTRANVVEYGRIQMTIDGWIHWIYRTNEGSQDRIYYRRHAAWDTSWQAEKLVASPSNGGVAGAYHTGIDFALDRQGSIETTYLCIVAGTQVGANQGVTCYGVSVTPPNNITVNNGLISGTRQWLSTGTGRVSTSADKEHVGDGLTRSGNPNVWVAWGRTSVRMVKLAWSSGKWVGPTTPIVVAASVAAQDAMPARWDGERFLMAIPDPAATDRVLVYQRDRANTTTSSVQTPAHPQGVIRSWGVNYNTSTGDLRVYAVGTSTAVLYYVDYVRATGLWTSWATVTATAILGTPPVNWGTRPATNGPARYDVYTAHSGTPNTLVHTRQAVAYPPSAPEWNAASTPYASGGAASVSAALVLDWDFKDADPSDVQSAYALSRQIGAGAVQYWRASDSTWQAAEVKNASATSAVTLASGWGLATDAAHTYKVKTWDSADTASQYGAGLAVTPSSPSAPTITAPTPAAVITADTVTVTWTVAEQSAYRVRLTNAGGQLLDTGWVQSTDTSYTPPTKLADGGAYTVYLATKNTKGLASAEVSVAFTVDYVAPATPTLVVTPLPASGVMRVAVTNPAPAGGQPAVSAQTLYRRKVGDTSNGSVAATSLASGATVDDWRAAGRTAYEYRVEVQGVNGTTGWSAWTA